MSRARTSPLLNVFGGIALALALGACAGKMPVPGGTDDVNKNCFSSIPDMQARLVKLKPGMIESSALATLCVKGKREDFARLSRRDIRIALLGGDNVRFDDQHADADSEIIRNLYGYKLMYRDTKRRHGFSSPIRIVTNETGFNYTITLIFKDGLLFEEPILSGGLVNENNSRTIFDFITPGTVIDKAFPG